MSAYYNYINQTYNDISKKYSYLKKSGICLKKISDSRLASQQHVNNGYWALTIQVFHFKNGKFGKSTQTAMLQTLYDYFQYPTLSHDKTPDHGRLG